MLSINISELIWTIVNFFLLYFLLKHFLYAPVTRFLDAREARVNEAQAREKTARAELEESERQIEERKAIRREEAKEIVSAAHEEDLRRSRIALDEARDEDEKALERALEQIRAAGEAERASLAAETDALASLLAGKLLENGTEKQ